jgi:hypothetical protein
MNCLSTLFAIAVAFPAPATFQDPDLTPEQLTLLETLLEENVITQAEFDKRTGRDLSPDTSQDPPLTAEQVTLLESLLEDGVLTQEEFDKRVKREPEPVVPALTPEELDLLETLLEEGVITEAEFGKRGGNIAPADPSSDPIPQADLADKKFRVNSGVQVGESSGSRVRGKLFYRDLEYGAFNGSIVHLETGVVLDTPKFRDVPVKRIGLQFDFGEVSGQVFKEDLSGRYDLFGLGISTEQQGIVSGGTGPAPMIFEWDLGLNVAFGDGDAPVYNKDGAQIGEINTGAWYAEVSGRLGAGVAFSPVTVTGGLALSTVRGEFNNDLGTYDFDGSNLGFYVGARSDPNNSKFTAGVDAYFGDINGVAVTVGVSL